MNKWQIPSTWTWKTLSEVSEVNPRRPRIIREDVVPTSFVPMEDVDEKEGRFRQVQIKPFGEVKRGYTYFEENDVLYAKITPSMENGKTAIARGLIDAFGFGTTEFHVFRPNPGILPEYLHYYIRRTPFRQEAKEHFRGAVGQQRVPQGFLVDYPVPLPYPDDPARSLAEQRRIVARIEALLAEVGEMRTLQAEIARDTNELLQAARREVFGMHPEADWVPLSTYVRVIENGRSPQAQNRPAQGQEWGVLKVGAVTYGYFKSDENKALLPGTAPRTEFEVKQGDFLMSRANTLLLVGACAFVKEVPPPRLLLSDKTFRFHFQEEFEMNPAYFDNVLKSYPLRQQIQAVASGTSPTMKNISKEKVMNLLVPQHSPDEQNFIASHFAYMSDEIREMQQINREDEKLLIDVEQAILTQAFRGEL